MDQAILMIYSKSIPSSDHYAKDEIQTRLNGLQEKWDNLKVSKTSVCRYLASYVCVSFTFHNSRD